MFEIGKVYKRKEELHEIYGGQRQGGISTPSDQDFIFLFTSDAGVAYGYSDQFRPDGIFLYTGEGQVGDMKMIKGNLAIRDHQENDKTLHLFEYVRKANVRYVGEALCVDHHIELRPDRDDGMRNAIIFHLAVNMEQGDADEGEPVSDTVELKTLRHKSLSDLRNAALKKVAPNASSRTVTVTTRVRSEAIKLYALKRAGGVCEGCDSPAPFMSKRGPYLEVHHMYRLGDGGPDYPENVIAVCPNCHRRVHSGIDGYEYNQELVSKINLLEG